MSALIKANDATPAPYQLKHIKLKGASLTHEDVTGHGRFHITMSTDKCIHNTLESSERSP